MRRGRKRAVLSEVMKKEQQCLLSSMGRQQMLPIFYQQEYLRKNRFIVTMHSDTHSFRPERIQGFNIHKDDQKHLIVIKTTLLVSEWIDDLREITIIQVQFVDVLGNELRFIDLDVSFAGYSVGCDYAVDELLVPVFTYNILD